METVQKAAIWIFVQIVAVVGLAVGAMCFVLVAMLESTIILGIATGVIGIVGWYRRHNCLTVGKFFADAIMIGYLFCLMVFLGAI